MKIALGCDHGGYALKQDIIKVLEKLGHEYEDFGCYSTESCDYPDFGAAAARAVAEGKCDRGIVICTTGIGISIAANKITGKKLPGRMGGERVTVQRLTVVRVDKDRNLILIKGAIPGPKKSFVVIKNTCKPGKN